MTSICKNGHDTEKVGVTKRTKECRYCYKARQQRARVAQRRDGTPIGPKRTESKTTGRNGNVEHRDESIRSKQILALIDDKSRASTAWERREIQEQIDALAGKRANHGS